MLRMVIGFFLFISIILWTYVYIKNNNYTYEHFNESYKLK